jgi:hypothetical protein
MRTDLGTSPKVVRLASALKADRFRIVGGLHSAWSLFDAHSEDGSLVGYTVDVLDDLIGWPGFSQAMANVGWLDVTPQGLVLPRFDAHNGQSAKRRAQDADRKRVRRMSASEADARPENVRPREEKRREEIKLEAKATVHSAAPTAPMPAMDQLGGDRPTPEVPKRIRGEKPPQTAARFPEFWAVYPVKKGKAAALRSWKAKGCDAIADQIIAHVRRMEREDSDWLRGFIPHGSTYITGERWDDEPKREGAPPVAPPPTKGLKEVLAEGESKLENAIGYIRQLHQRGDLGEGQAGVAERDRRIAEATLKYRQEG